MDSTSYIEISKSALKNNIEFVKSLIKEGVQLSSVVKGDAYGHRIDCFVPIAEECGIEHFSVFSSDEARKVLKSAKENPTVMIMGMIENEELPWAIENDVEFFVFELNRLEHAIQTATRLNKKAKIHLELETGLNRTGFTKKEMRAHLPLFQSNFIEVIGICTHFAGAESIANFYRIKEQKKRFGQLSKWLINNGIHYKIRHTACSAALIRFPETHMEMVRIGIMQYGFWPSMETLIHYITKRGKTDVSPLKRILSWKSKVMSVKDVPAGQFISYGTTYLTGNTTKTASVPVGYAHGYDRGLSNKGRVIINGQRVNVIGLVNMNMLLVDISEAGDVNKGDEVILIGQQGDYEVSVASFSELSNQLNYEMLTRLPNNISRKIVA